MRIKLPTVSGIKFCLKVKHIILILSAAAIESHKLPGLHGKHIESSFELNIWFKMDKTYMYTN